MIFSRLFSPAHKSPDATKRKQAVKTLSTDKPEEKSILHELAFNDADPQVSLAALEKLDSFALWQKMSQIASVDKIKRVATQRVEQSLFGTDPTPLTDGERKAYLLESAGSELIVRVVEERPDLLSDKPFVASLVERMARPAFTQRILLNARDPELTQLLLNDTQDTDLLQRLSRKFDDAACLAVVNARLQSLREAQEKPAALEKSLTLTLSKLQALTDKADYARIREASETLHSEYETAWADHDCLSDVLQVSFAQKYKRISDQVNRHLELIRPQWEAQQAALAEEQAVAAAQSQLKTATASLHSLYETRLCEATLSEVESVSQHVRELEDKVESLQRTGTSTPTIKRLQAEQKKLTEKLDTFSAQQQLAIKAVAVLQELESLSAEPESEEKAEAVASLSSQWRELSGHLMHVPADWKARWRECHRAAKAKQSKENAEADQRIKQCRKHINAVINLIDNGRFRAAMSRFQKLVEQYQQLSDKEQAKISRRFEQVKQDVERLEGWQSYLAAPRRPALIEEARELASKAPDNVGQRAESIRYLRKQWQSLFVPGEENKDEQRTFDALLEQAFAPCREHYAELDRQREQATKERASLVEAAEQLDTTIAPSTLNQQVEKLKQQWRQCGQVEQGTYKRLKAAFDAALNKAQEVISDWHQSNRQQKQALVEQARALAGSEDVFDASAQAQSLQQQWKEVGHAGRRYETKLWQAFKDANDALFSKVKSVKTQQRKDSDVALDGFFAKADEIKRLIRTDRLRDSAQAIDDLTSDIQELPKAAKGKAQKAVDALRDTLQKEQRKLTADRNRKRYQVLTEVVAQLAKQPVAEIDDAMISELDKAWQDALMRSGAAEKDRQWLTTALEVLIDLPSPQADTELRKTVQLALLTAKLERGESWDKDDLLAQWLSHGRLSDDEQPLVSRVQQCLNVLLDDGQGRS